MKPYLRLEWTQRALAAAVLAWAGIATFATVRSRPQVILIGLDENGARVIQSATDPLLARERIKFVKEFLLRFYHYNSSAFETAASRAGDLMSEALWKEKEPELRKIAERIKTSPPFAQEARLLDLREIDETEFEADLEVRVTTRMVDKVARYRAAITVGARKRNTDNPYAWEVGSLHETELR